MEGRPTFWLLRDPTAEFAGQHRRCPQGWLAHAVNSAVAITGLPVQ